MELPHNAPPIPKLPFLLGDLVFLAIAAFLALQAGDAQSVAIISGIIICAGLGVGLGVAPFVIDYARQQDLQLAERQHALESLARTTSTAMNQASITANGLNEISESSKMTLQMLEELSTQIKTAPKEMAATSAKDPELASLRDEISALQKSIIQQSKSLGKLLTDAAVTVPAAAPEVAPPPPPSLPRKPAIKKAPPQEPVTKKPAIKKAPPQEPATKKPAAKKSAKRKPPQKQAVAKARKPAKTADDSPAAAPKPKSAEAKDATSSSEPVSIDELFDDAEENILRPIEGSERDETETAVSPETATEPTKNPRATLKKPRKTKGQRDKAVENPSLDPDAGTTEPPTEPEPTASLASDQDEDATAADPKDEPALPEPLLSPDGSTRLTVTAYIGIGNRLFIRGDGPGLSRQEGTPLQFVSIGKWRWESDAATEPVKATLWKNDQEECTALGEIEITPGTQMEAEALF